MVRVITFGEENLELCDFLCLFPSSVLSLPVSLTLTSPAPPIPPHPTPPLAGRSDPQISISTREGNGQIRRLSNPTSYRPGPASLAPDGQTQATRLPRSPSGGVMRGQRPMVSWEGQPPTGQGGSPATSPQNTQGPIRWGPERFRLSFLFPLYLLPYP